MRKRTYTERMLAFFVGVLTAYAAQKYGIDITGIELPI